MIIPEHDVSCRDSAARRRRRHHLLDHVGVFARHVLHVRSVRLPGRHRNVNALDLPDRVGNRKGVFAIPQFPCKERRQHHLRTRPVVHFHVAQDVFDTISFSACADPQAIPPSAAFCTMEAIVEEFEVRPTPQARLASPGSHKPLLRGSGIGRAIHCKAGGSGSSRSQDLKLENFEVPTS